MSKNCSVLHIFPELHKLFRDGYYCENNYSSTENKDRLLELLNIWCDSDCGDACNNECVYTRAQYDWIQMLKFNSLYELLDYYCCEEFPEDGKLVPRAGGEITGNPAGRVPGNYGNNQ